MLRGCRWAYRYILEPLECVNFTQKLYALLVPTPSSHAISTLSLGLGYPSRHVTFLVGFRTSCLGTLLFVACNLLLFAMGLALAHWYQDCDPFMTGQITRLDQVGCYGVPTRNATFLNRLLVWEFS